MNHGAAAAPTGPRLAAYLYALLVAAALGHFLLGIPVQFTDCYGNMVKLAMPWGALLESEFMARAYLRPFLWAELKLVYDASGGNYFPWFRGVHVAQVAALLLMYVGLVRPASWRDVAILPLGIATLIGMHTFLGTVSEAFPVNTFMTVLLCCLAAANLTFAAHRWWTDVAALVLFVVAALTVESGLLVWVVFIGAALVGARGVSRAGLAGLTMLLVGYFVMRFAVLEVGSPGLIERSSGFGFRGLETDELIARFGDNPTWFYAYNIATSAVSVLLSEPRAGVFRLVRGIVLNEPPPSAIVNVIASICATGVIGAYVWSRRGAWRSLRFEHDDRLVLLFVMVLGANAVISYPYTKDVIMSPAGMFFAVALFAAARGVLPAPGQPVGVPRAIVLCALCAVLAVTWAIRSVGVHLNLRETARKVRMEWALAEEWLADEKQTITNPRALRLFQDLQQDAIDRRPPVPRLPLADHPWFDVD